jgi:Nucleotidyl transferase of unknown function (DUF2204)
VPPRSPVADLLARLSTAFERRGDRWFLFGAQAVAAYGVPRVTADVDVTVVLGDGQPRALALALGEAGMRLRVADVDGFAERTSVLPFIDDSSGLAVDVVLARSGLELECLERAVPIEMEGVTIPVITAEDLVILKVLAGRPKDREDVRALLRREARPFDFDRVERVLGLLEEALGQSDLLPAFGALKPGPTRETSPASSPVRSPRSPKRSKRKAR